MLLPRCPEGTAAGRRSPGGEFAARGPLDRRGGASPAEESFAPRSRQEHCRPWGIPVVEGPIRHSQRQNRRTRREAQAQSRARLLSEEQERLRVFEDTEVVSPQVRAAFFQMLENRRSRTDAMMWQVPTLALTAQAFLLSISLAPETSALGRCFAAIAGILVVVVSLQLMLKHRYHELLYSEWLAEAEKEQGLPRIHQLHAVEAFAYGEPGHPWKREPPAKASPLARLAWQIRRFAVAESSSLSLWRSALFALLAMDIAILGIGIAAMLGMWDPL